MNPSLFLQHRRDREARLRFMRMAAFSLLVHALILGAIALTSRTGKAHSFRESAILVTFREAPRPRAGAPVPPAATIPPAEAKPVQVEVSVPAPPVPVKPAAAKPEKVIPKNPTRSEVKTGGPGEGPRLTKSEQAAMESALENLRRQVQGSEQGAREAEWNAAWAEISGSVQSRVYHQQAGQALAAAWTPPIGVAPDLLVRVLVKLEADGTIRGWSLIQRSGDAALDASVERLFQKVTKLDPVPWAGAGELINLPIEFRPGAGED